MPRTSPKAGVDVAAAVDRERKRANVRSLDLSFNELADMYSTGELHITPDYQRTFRWSDAKESLFIESVILEMPIPPIYAVEVKEAEWELIDGLQRLSTYLHFRGQLELPDRDIRKGVDFLKLDGCDIVTELNGLKFDDLPTSLQYRVRRATLRVELVRRESNPRFSFYMFKRLNTGGEPLSDQEARNCSVRLLGDTFINFVRDLKTDTSFQKCIEDLTDEARARMAEDELVVRFFAFKNQMNDYVHDIDPFLTEYMERVTDNKSPENIPFDYKLEEAVFRRTFEVLAKTLGPHASQRWATTHYGGGFSMSHYESFSIGLATALSTGRPPSKKQEFEAIKAAMEGVKKQPEFKAITTGGGKNFRKTYERKIGIVRDAIVAAL